MRNSKQCPKCGSKEVYTNETLTKYGERNLVSVSTWLSANISAYVCVDCGYLEEYVELSDLAKGKIVEKIKKNWKKASE